MTEHPTMSAEQIWRAAGEGAVVTGPIAALTCWS